MQMGRQRLREVGSLVQGHPTWNPTPGICSCPKAEATSRPLDPTSPRSVECKHSQPCEHQVARTGQTVWFHDLLRPPPCCLLKGRAVVAGGWEPGLPCHGVDWSDGQPILAAGAGVGEAPAPSCPDTLSLSLDTKGALSSPGRASSTCSGRPQPLCLEKGPLCRVKRLTCFFFIKTC